ncbi:MAG: PAS domain-containing protein [Halobacteriales archaeon]
MSRVKLLHVEDDDAYAELTEHHLREHGFDYERAVDAEEALDAVGDVDCVVSDYDLPGKDGIELLRRIRERTDLPFVLYTSHGSEEVASEAISEGVTDYVQKEVGKEDFELLAKRVRDSVDAHRTEVELREHRRMLENLVENVPGLVYRCRNEIGWPFEFVSEGSVDLTGYTPGELQGEVSWGDDVVHPDDRDWLWREIQESEDGFEVTYRIVDADGDVRWAWERGRFVEDGEAIEGLIVDVTRRVRMEERYQRLVEQNLVGIYLLQDGVVRFANPRAAEIFGYTVDEVEGLDVLELIAPEDHETVRRNMRRREDGDTEEIRYEVGAVRKDGSGFSIEVHGGVVEHEGEPAILGVVIER